jgi:hypothetical protein
MKRSILIVYSILFINSCLLAQNNESVTVKAGTRLIDYFPVAERYLYADFTKGEAVFTNERTYQSMFNYNFLSGEMEFINSNDTLIIKDKSDLISIVVAKDTFYYDSGYLQIIRNGPLKVCLKQIFVIKDILKKGAMGTVNRSAASESYDYLLTSPLSRDLVADIDMVFRKEELYFFSITGEDFRRFTRNNIIRSVPGKKDIIDNYILSTKTDFKSREDLLRLADIVNMLLAEKS